MRKRAQNKIMNQEEQNNEFYQKLMELSEVDDKFKKGLEGLSDKEKLEQYIPQYDGVMVYFSRVLQPIHDAVRRL